MERGYILVNLSDAHNIDIRKIEDLEDIQAFEDAKNDHKIPWEEVQKELGL
jgi:hypothetical protein